MIGLEVRKVVDTSAWDQSFVVGGESSENGLAMVTSGTDVPVPAVDRRRPFVEPDVRNHVIRPISRGFNPFLDHSECQSVTDCHVTTSPKVFHPGHRLGSANRAVHVLDLCGRGLLASRTELPVPDVATWLDSLEPFESRSSSSSSPTNTNTTTTGDRNHRSTTTLDPLSPDVPRTPPEGAPPPSSLAAYSRAVSFLPAWDIDRLQSVYSRLDSSGFYLGRMSMEEARIRLNGYPVGTFLLRDSSDSRFLFSLSVQTRRGTTSIRVLYEAGLFRLDSDPEQVHLMPTFDCVLALIRHYIRRGSTTSGRPPSDSSSSGSYVFRETTGRKDTPVLLRRPLETSPSTLAHICRRSIHRTLGCCTRNIGRLHLRPSLKDFLAEYPYDI